MLHGGQACARRVQYVPLHNIDLRMVHHSAEPDLASLIQRGLHDIGRSAEKLDAGSTLLGHTSDPLTSIPFFQKRATSTLPEPHIRKNPWCSDCIRLTAFLVINYPIQT